MKYLTVILALLIASCDFHDTAYQFVPGGLYSATFTHNGRDYTLVSTADQFPDFYFGDSLAMRIHYRLPADFSGEMYPALDTTQAVYFFPEFFMSDNGGKIILDGEQFAFINILRYEPGANDREVWFDLFFNSIPEPCGFGTDKPSCINLFTEGKIAIRL